MDEKIVCIFREVLNDPTLEIDENSTAADVNGWDSFNHINLIMCIEDEYSISFTTAEIGQMGRVADLLRMIKSKTS